MIKSVRAKLRTLYSKFATKRRVKLDQFDLAPTELAVRAEKLRRGDVVSGVPFTTDTTMSTAELIDSIGILIKTLGGASRVADRATRLVIWLTIVGVVVAVTNVVLVIVQIRETDRAVHTQNSIALNGQFFHDPINLQIIDAIENQKPILAEHHGRTTPTELDNYLGDLDTIYDAYTDKQISEEELCGSFSTVVTETFRNVEIQKYLRDNTDYFGGAVELADVVKKSKIDECH
jgi:hypothetical protein